MNEKDQENNGDRNVVVGSELTFSLVVEFGL